MPRRLEGIELISIAIVENVRKASAEKVAALTAGQSARIEKSVD